MPVPESSGCAGHPPFAHNAAISATIFGSVTRRASPETITSKPFVATLTVQRGSRAMFFALRVHSPVWNQHEPACQSAPTLVTCGLPSVFRVVSQNVGRFGECGSVCVKSSASCVVTLDHSIAGSASAAPRFVVFMELETPPHPEIHRELASAGCARPRASALSVSRGNVEVDGRPSASHTRDRASPTGSSHWTDLHTCDTAPTGKLSVHVS